MITLGIIGIVAALTIPTLVTKYQQHLFVNKVKQTYSLVSNAMLASAAQNGTPDQWLYVTLDGKDENYVQNFSNHMKETATKYFKPYLKTIGEGNENFGYYLILQNGVTLYFYPDGSFNNYTDKIFSQTRFFIVGSINNNHSYWLDQSRDYSRKDFVMEINKNYKTPKVSLFCSNGDIKNITDESGYRCNKNNVKNQRACCAALLQKNGWRITKDYPWD